MTVNLIWPTELTEGERKAAREILFSPPMVTLLRAAANHMPNTPGFEDPGHRHAFHMGYAAALHMLPALALPPAETTNDPLT